MKTLAGSGNNSDNDEDYFNDMPINPAPRRFSMAVTSRSNIKLTDSRRK